MGFDRLPEPQSDKKCKECEHDEEDFLKEPCLSCWNCSERHSFKEKEYDETRNNESEQMGGKNCPGCREDLSQ